MTSKRSLLILLFIADHALAAASVKGQFVSAGEMQFTRWGHAATLLADDTVLITGGRDAHWTRLSSAELYDPSKGTFVRVGDMNVPRASHTATLLADGRVLLAGGSGETTAEIYDPESRTFTRTGDILEPQEGTDAAILLRNGEVLLAGGLLEQPPYPTAARAERYDPLTGTFRFAAEYADADTTYSRGPNWATTTQLPDGRVLVVGNNPAEIYNPDEDSFALTGPMAGRRYDGDLWFYWHTSTVLDDGTVLILGGNDEWDCPGIPDSDRYDPEKGEFVGGAAMAGGRMGHAATRMSNGRVLVTGGGAGWCYMSTSASAEIFDPLKGAFSRTAPMASPRAFHTSTLLRDGSVLVVGGQSWNRPMPASECAGGVCVTRSAELYRNRDGALCSLLPRKNGARSENRAPEQLVPGPSPRHPSGAHEGRAMLGTR